MECAEQWKRDRLVAVLKRTLGEAAHAALTAPDAALEALRLMVATSVATPNHVSPLFALMVRGARPEALRSTQLLPREVRLLWAAGQAPPAVVYTGGYPDDDDEVRFLCASLRLLGYSPLAPAAAPAEDDE